MLRAIPVLLLLIHLSPFATAAPPVFTASFSDPVWDGVSVPEGYQCQKFGGVHGSPTLLITGIPPEANALILAFSDRDYGPMDKGGHGVIGFAFTGASDTVSVPTIPPHTTDLPAGFWIVAEHLAPGWDKAGAYLPPCSGGGGNAYYVTVTAVTRDGDELTELKQTALEMGKY